MNAPGRPGRDEPAPARSCLFVPADRPERFAKALASGADEVIVDLEDAVAPAAKEQARRALAQWLASPGDAQVVVRINGCATPWFTDDLALVAGAARIAAVMLPKAEAASPWPELGAVDVIALVESAAGVADARSVARVPQVRRIAFGSLDYALDLGIAGDPEALLLARSELVLASRAAGLPAPIDGVCTSIGDADALSTHAMRARRLGFGGVLCIHPSQVAAVNDAFLPSAEDAAWARRVLAAAQQAGGAAVAVDGKMVDRPVMARAEAILAALSNARRP